MRRDETRRDESTQDETILFKYYLNQLLLFQLMTSTPSLLFSSPYLHCFTLYTLHFTLHTTYSHRSSWVSGCIRSVDSVPQACSCLCESPSSTSSPLRGYSLGPCSTSVEVRMQWRHLVPLRGLFWNLGSKVLACMSLQKVICDICVSLFLSLWRKYWLN